MTQTFAVSTKSPVSPVKVSPDAIANASIMTAGATPRVLIIGAAITGLLVVHGLAKAGIAYTISEAEEVKTTRPRKWTMSIHWGLPLLDSCCRIIWSLGT